MKLVSDIVKGGESGDLLQWQGKGQMQRQLVESTLQTRGASDESAKRRVQPPSSRDRLIIPTVGALKMKSIVFSDVAATVTDS